LKFVFWLQIILVINLWVFLFFSFILQLNGIITPVVIRVGFCFIFLYILWVFFVRWLLFNIEYYLIHLNWILSLFRRRCWSYCHRFWLFSSWHGYYFFFLNLEHIVEDWWLSWLFLIRSKLLLRCILAWLSIILLLIVNLDIRFTIIVVFIIFVVKKTLSIEEIGFATLAIFEILISFILIFILFVCIILRHFIFCFLCLQVSLMQFLYKSDDLKKRKEDQMNLNYFAQFLIYQ